MSKSLDKPVFNGVGRAIQFHQSPWDLKVRLGASGAEMMVGVSVHKTHDELLSLRWRPPTEMNKETHTYAYCVLLDIMEACHIVPDTLKTFLEEASGAQAATPPP